MEKNLIKKLFNQASTKRSVVIPENFSIEANILPNKEVKYKRISHYLRDANFAPLAPGSAILAIIRMNSFTSGQELAERRKMIAGVRPQNAMAIIAALHETLLADPGFLNKYQEGLLINVLSNKPMINGRLFCLRLSMYKDSWCWSHMDGSNHLMVWDTGVDIAILL